MIPQSNFMILAPIAPGQEETLRRLLAAMNHGPGQVNADNPLVPFSKLDTLHFARFVILDDKTLDDVCVYGLPAGSYPRYLAFLGDVDGDIDAFLGTLAGLAEPGLRKVFACCAGLTADSDLLGWMKSHNAPAITSYVNCRGRTVRQVREEAVLKAALDGYLQGQASTLRGLPAKEVVLAIRRFVQTEQSAGRLTLSTEGPTPPAWWLKNALHLVGLPLILLLASPLLIVIGPFYLIWLRRLEKSDAELCSRVSQGYSDELALLEDHGVTNQFTAMGSLKPGLIRLWTLIGVLLTVDYAARHIVRPGRLGRVRTIHFARWVFLDGRKRMVFFSNYDGTVESYMDDFINKTGFGLNAVFGNGVGYPRTNWLVHDGCASEQKYRNFLRRHTLPTQVWYKAYPGLTAVDLERNTRIRRGLASVTMSDSTAREWMALL